MEPGANIDLSQFSKLDSNVFVKEITGYVEVNSLRVRHNLQPRAVTRGPLIIGTK